MSDSVGEIIVWGAGGHAAVVTEILRLNGWSITALLVDEEFRDTAAQLHDLPVFSSPTGLDRVKLMGVRAAAVAVGDCDARLRIGLMLEGEGFDLPVAVHPCAHVAADAVLGAGTVVAAGAVINPAVRIGKLGIINTCASVDHNCTLGDSVHIGPGAHIAGTVHLGERCWIGIGASVIDHLTIGAGAVVGAGAAVISDIPPYSVAVGVPAKVVRTRQS